MAGVIDQPLTILHTNLAVYIGIVYAYVPFMVLPIYTALIRIDYSLVEAALDLGARPLKTFFNVIVPLTKGGIIAGSMLVFIPAVGGCDPGTARWPGQHHDRARAVAGVL